MVGVGEVWLESESVLDLVVVLVLVLMYPTIDDDDKLYTASHKPAGGNSNSSVVSEQKATDVKWDSSPLPKYLCPLHLAAAQPPLQRPHHGSADRRARRREPTNRSSLAPRAGAKQCTPYRVPGPGFAVFVVPGTPATKGPRGDHRGHGRQWIRGGIWVPDFEGLFPGAIFPSRADGIPTVQPRITRGCTAARRRRGADGDACTCTLCLPHSLTHLTLGHRRTQRLPSPHRPRLAPSPSRIPTTSTRTPPDTPGSAHPTHSSSFYLCWPTYLATFDDDAHPARADWLRSRGSMTSWAFMVVGQRSPWRLFFAGFPLWGAVGETVGESRLRRSSFARPGPMMVVSVGRGQRMYLHQRYLSLPRSDEPSPTYAHAHAHGLPLSLLRRQAHHPPSPPPVNSA
jgi:hypothetical protein